VVAGARVEITGGNLPQPIVLTSDESGRFSAPNLSAGKYSVHVTRDGFGDLLTTVDLHGSADLPLNLTIAVQQARVNVSEKSMAFANSDPAYQQLRNIGLGDTYRCENFTMSLDVGTFELRSGTITLLAPVNHFVTGAIFVGQGHFTLKPIALIDAREIMRRTGGSTVEEDFTEVVFRFTSGEYRQFVAGFGPKADTPPEAAAKV
jgi:hypothetical protein